VEKRKAFRSPVDVFLTDEEGSSNAIHTPIRDAQGLNRVELEDAYGWNSK